MIGVVAAEAFHGCGRSANRLIPRTFDHAAIFAQSLAIKSQHLVPAVSSGVVSRLHPQLPGAEPHVDFRRPVAVPRGVKDRIGIGGETKFGGRGLVFVDVDPSKRGGNLYVVAPPLLDLSTCTLQPVTPARRTASKKSPSAVSRKGMFSSPLRMCTRARPSMFPENTPQRNAGTKAGMVPGAAKLRLSSTWRISERGGSAAIFSTRPSCVPIQSRLFSPIQLAGVTFPTASSSLRCANTRAQMDSATTGTWSIWAAGR